MKPNLLTDILNEGDYAEFRERLETQFRNRVARNTWRRRAKWFAAAAAVALIAFLNTTKRSDIVTQAVVPPRDAVPTIRTSSIKLNDLLVSPQEPVPIIRTHAFTTEMITTDHSQRFPSISDDELLRFFPKHPTGLMAAHGEKRFIFVDPADAKRFMSSN